MYMHTLNACLLYAHDRNRPFNSNYWHVMSPPPLTASWMCASCWFWPATVAEDEEEHAEDDAGNADVNANYDARGGCFALIIFHTVAWAVQHWGDIAHNTVTSQLVVLGLFMWHEGQFHKYKRCYCCEEHRFTVMRCSQQLCHNVYIFGGSV